jgi:hypothetical protein
VKYDDASWHCGGDFPKGQPEEHGGTHIALFLKWCFVRGWAGAIHLDEEPEAVAAVVNGELSASDFFFKYCDGKLVSEMLSEGGNNFAERYYGNDGLYLEDYANGFGELMYVAGEEAHDFEKFSAILDARFRSGILTKKQSRPKPWWKIW